jgi:serine/threonine protein kinase
MSAARYLLPGIPRHMANPLVFVEIPAVVNNNAATRVLPSGETVCKRYWRGALLGTGGFAHCVVLVSADYGTAYAAKVVSLSAVRLKPAAAEQLVAEFLIQQPLRHINIVRVFNLFRDEYNYYILSEMCAQRTLLHLIRQRGRLSEPAVRQWMRQLLEAVCYLHERNIVHLDIKPSNLYIDSTMCLKLGDFGLAKQLKDGVVGFTTRCGTPNYMAPEIVRRQLYSFPADVWSAGVVMYVMLCGYPPFEKQEVGDTYRTIMDGTYLVPKHVSSEASSMMQAMMTTSPHERPSARQLLGHAFMAPAPARLLIPSLVAVDTGDRHVLNASVEDVHGMQCLRSRTHPKGNIHGATDVTTTAQQHSAAIERCSPPLSTTRYSRVTRAMSKLKIQ